MFTQLANRKLWFDGDVEVSARDLVDFVAIPQCAGKLFVDVMSPDVIQYNKMVPKGSHIRSKKETLNRLDFKWDIPPEYLKIDLIEFFMQKEERNGTAADDDRYIRIAEEIKLYQQHKLLDFLRVLIFIINTLHTNNVVWGVGRGSSVSSYLLYLVGVHDVDSYEYGLDITDFLR